MPLLRSDSPIVGTGLDLELLDVDGGVVILPHQLLGDQDGVLEVVAAPGHEGHQHVAAEGQLAELGAGTVGQHVPLLHPLPLGDHRLLSDAGVLVGAAELDELIDVGAEVLGLAGVQVLALDAHDDALGVHRVDDAAALGEHHGSGVLGHDPLEARADDGRVAAQQRHRLALHVRAHEGAVGVVVLEERNERRRHRHELLRADVHVVDAVALRRDEVAAGARDHPLADEHAVLVEAGVGLRDDVLLLLPGREVEGVRLGVDHPLAGLLQARVLRLELVAGDDLSETEGAVAHLEHPEVIDHAAALHFLVGALDEAVVVDPGIGRERRDEADVRPFRRLDGTDTAVVRGVDVAHLEPGPLAGQTARSEGGEPPLVGDLGERVRLVHELRQLRGAEELLDRRDDRLGVDQVVGHRRVDVLVDGHLLLDRPLHAHEADAELVLQQLAHRAHAAVAQVVDVVDAADVLLQPQQILDDAEEIVRRQGLLVDRHLGVQLDVELEAADAREVVALGVEEHAVEQRPGALQGRRVAGTHAPVDLDQRLFGVAGGVLGQGVGQRRTHQLPVREEDLNLSRTAAVEPLLDVLGHQLVGLEQHLAGVEVDDVGDEEGALQILLADFESQGLAGVELADLLARQGDAGEDRVRLTPAAALPVLQPLGVQDLGGDVQIELAAALGGEADRGVELAQDRLVGLETQGAQEYRAVELPLAVDAHRQHVLLVVLELHPRAAVRDDLRQVGAGPLLGEEDAGAAVELGDDDALRAVDDEGAVVRHQRDVAEVDLLLLGVAHHARARLRIAVVDEEAEGDLERHGEGHPPLLAIGDGVLELEVHRVAADVALRHPVLVHEAALGAGHRLLVRMVRHDLGAAVGAGHAEVFEALELAALALPVADRVLDEVERAGLAKVGEREDAGENRLQTLVRPLFGQQVHLQEALIAAPLNVDQVRNGERRPDSGEVLPMAVARWNLRGGERIHRDLAISSVPLIDLLGSQRYRGGWPKSSCSGSRRHHAQPPALPAEGHPSMVNNLQNRREPRFMPEAAPGPATSGSRRPVYRSRRAERVALFLVARAHLISMVAPASSNFFLTAAASSLETPSLTVAGADSTRSLASLRPRLVTSRTALMTLIFLSPAALRITSNSVCSSTGAAAAAPPPAGAATAAAAAETP